MDSSRRTSSQRDTTSQSFRASSSRSGILDVTRQLSTSYDRAYNTSNVARQGSSLSSYDRGYNTIDAVQSSAGDTERQTNDTAGQGGSHSGYDRAYSTYDPIQHSSSHLGFSPLPTRETSHRTDWDASSGLLGNAVSESHMRTFGDEPQSSTGLGSFTGSELQWQERSSRRTSLQNTIRSLRASLSRLRFSTRRRTRETSRRTESSVEPTLRVLPDSTMQPWETSPQTDQATTSDFGLSSSRATSLTWETSRQTDQKRDTDPLFGMSRSMFRDTEQSSKAEGTRRHTDDAIRWLASSSSRGDAESSSRPIETTHLDEREVTSAQAIDRGRTKMEKYQQETKNYQSKDRDTFEEFKKNFENNITKLKNSVVEVKSYASEIAGTYENEIDVENGRITGKYNRYFLPYSEEKLDFSEVIFNQLRLATEYINKEMSEFNLKYWYGNDVTNEDTRNTVELFFPKERGEDGLVKEGQKTFLAGTDAFTALAGTPTAQSKFYLLAQHPEIFKDKKVTSITVIRPSDKQIDIEYEFGSQLEQEEKASPKD